MVVTTRSRRERGDESASRSATIHALLDPSRPARRLIKVNTTRCGHFFARTRSRTGVARGPALPSVRPLSAPFSAHCDVQGRKRREFYGRLDSKEFDEDLGHTHKAEMPREKRWESDRRKRWLEARSFVGLLEHSTRIECFRTTHNSEIMMSIKHTSSISANFAGSDDQAPLDVQTGNRSRSSRSPSNAKLHHH